MKIENFYKLKEFNDNYLIPQFEKAGQLKLVEKISNCGEFKRLKVCNNCHTAYFDGFNCCKDRFCVICQKKRSLQLMAKYLPVIFDFIKKGYFINLITFTLVNNKSLKFNLGLMQKAWNHMTNYKVYRKEFKSRFTGGLKSLEIKIGQNSKLWHPHYHCLVLKKEFSKDFEFLKNAWNDSLCYVLGIDSTKNKIGSVDLRGLYSKSKNDLLSMICECFKYITKYGNLEENDLNELVSAVSGIRTKSTWGCLNGIKLDEFNTEEPFDKCLQRICAICGEYEFIDNLTSLEDKQLRDFNDLEIFDKDKAKQSQINTFKREYDMYEQILFKEFAKDTENLTNNKVNEFYKKGY